MKKITEKTKIYGRLITEMGDFDLLAPEPEKHNLPWYLRDGSYSFYVSGYDNIARHIIVKGNFIIMPFPETPEQDVNFLLDEEEG